MIKVINVTVSYGSEGSTRTPFRSEEGINFFAQRL